VIDHAEGTLRTADVTDIKIACTLDPARDGLFVGVEDPDLVDVQSLCGGSGGQPFYLTVGTAIKGETVLSAFGSGLTILHTQTNGMPDVTVWHGGLEPFRFDGKQYESAEGAAAPTHRP
jgi:hypothetical protein